MATVLQISDTHLRAAPHTPADMDPDESLLATIDAVRGVRADLVLLTGDLADDGSLAALQRLRAVVDDLSTPLLAVAGNHDDLDNVRRMFGIADTIEVGRWRVMGVESIIPGQDHGSVDVEKLIERLDRLDDRPTLMAIHHPPRSPSTNPLFQLIGADALLAALRDRPHVRAIVSGHLHEVFDRREGDLRIYGGPSSWYAIEHIGDDYRMFTDGLVGAQVLTLGDDGSFACNRVSRSLGC
ncbi:MAG: metallophosphoesterase [Ilumatobacteraceae bacterium]|nr:metallophosphoesterase [Ilumatobacteraceae bacterium]